MSLFAELLSSVAPSVSDQTLGDLAKKLTEMEDVTSVEVGAIIRSGVVNSEDGSRNTKSDTLPQDEVLRESLLDTIYRSFHNYSRRTVQAMSLATGLSKEAVLELIADNNDFRTSVGQESGDTYISLTGLND